MNDTNTTAADEHSYTGDTRPQTDPTTDTSTDSEFEYVRGDHWESAATVLDHLEATIDELGYHKSHEIADELDLSTQQVATALGVIVSTRDEDLGVTVERWSQTNKGITWRIEPTERELVTDGGQDTIPICPNDECASADCWPRGTRNSDAEKGWHCQECGLVFDDPAYRERGSTNGVNLREDTVARELLDADPDDLGDGKPVTDGGLDISLDELERRKSQRTSTSEDQLPHCPECGSLSLEFKIEKKPHPERKEGEARCNICGEHVDPVRPEDPELVTDGGWPEGDPCPDCGELMDVGAVGNPGETITWQECTDCEIGWGPWTGYVDTGDEDANLVADGGQQFWIIDESTQSIIDGPYPTRIEARGHLPIKDVGKFVVDDQALDFIETHGGELEDETGERGVATDGGRIPTETRVPRDDQELRTDGGVDADNPSDVADELVGISHTAEPALNDDELETLDRAADLLETLDARLPQDHLLRANEAFQDSDLGGMRLSGRCGFHTFYDNDSDDVTQAFETALHITLDELFEELWIDADSVEADQGEVTAETVVDETMLQIDDLVPIRFSPYGEELFRDTLADKLDALSGGDA